MRKFLHTFYLELMDKPFVFRWLLSLWPPFFFAGIRIAYVSPNYRHIKVILKETFYNRNHFNTHFGGSLFAMTDPFFVFMTLHNLGGSRYFVWDKKGEIEFVKPGKGCVHADLTLSSEQMDDIVEKTKDGDKFEPVFEADIKDKSGQVVARFRKTIYVRLKPQYRKPSNMTQT